MADQLVQGIAQRLMRAEELKVELQRAIEEFCQRKSCEVVHEIDQVSGVKTAIFRTTEVIPARWTVLVGDMIHNLRSSLDQAVYYLTIQQSGNPIERSEFPIFMDPILFERTGPGGGRHKIRGLSEVTQNVIESMQPYHVRGQDQLSTLWLLHQLSNIDKHRQPHFCRITPAVIRIEFVKEITSSDDIILNTPIGILPDSALLAQWKPVGELDTSEVVRAWVDFQIVFDPVLIPNIWTKPAVEICDTLVVGVRAALGHLGLKA